MNDEKKPMGDAVGAMRAAGERMQAAGKAASEESSKLGVRLLDQAEENTREAFRAMRAAAGASDLSEVMRIQADYMREQGSRSVAQAREVSEMIVRFGRSAVGQLTGRD